MESIALSLLDRDHGRNFTDSARGPRGNPAYHPLKHATRMMLRFRDHNPEYDGPGEDLERVALLLDGDGLPDIGLKPTVTPKERCFGIPWLVVFRESPVPYRMRAVCLPVPTELADAFETELSAVNKYLTASRIIGTLASIATGCRENERPPLSYTWNPLINSTADRTDVFVFLQVSLKDRPGQQDRRSCWIRLKQHYIYKGVINEKQPGNRRFESFADLWPLLDKVSLVTSL